MMRASKDLAQSNMSPQFDLASRLGQEVGNCRPLHMVTTRPYVRPVVVEIAASLMNQSSAE